MKTKQLKYPANKINRDFKIKINGQGISTLVGVSGLINHIGVDNANTMLDRAYREGKDIFVGRLRRGLVIRLYVK